MSTQKQAARPKSRNHSALAMTPKSYLPERSHDSTWLRSTSTRVKRMRNCGSCCQAPWGRGSTRRPCRSGRSRTQVAVAPPRVSSAPWTATSDWRGGFRRCNGEERGFTKDVLFVKVPEGRKRVPESKSQRNLPHHIRPPILI